ncbi:type II and III secretion system protein family protein [Paremcibacter congregatus]|uniref:type II and III secretion system protein family protein n=1 Tax=Paremcibacter congregatus TaxID=2043170 RepID=UPI0030EF6E04|tara:strand:+ start:6601 stop:8058 length:1458 start_codon:yes stop_codon:yes gene_type:complete
MINPVKTYTSIPLMKHLLRCSVMVVTAATLCVSAPMSASAEKKVEQNNIEVGKGTLLRFKEPVNNVFIANTAIADLQVKSPTLVYIYGKQQGETNLYAVTDDDRVIYEGKIAVNHNLGSLEAALSHVIPDASIQVQSYEGLLLLTGNVKSPEQAEDARRMAEDFIGKDKTIINKLQIATPVQVNLRVRIAEIGRDTKKQLGFSWENLFANGSTAIGVVQGANVVDLIPDPTGITNNLIKEFAVQGRGLNSLFGGFRAGNFDINFIIDALETEGVLSVLAEPNLTTLSGEPANFLAGGEYPIPSLDEGQVVIEYKEFGISLDFTPVVLDDGRINMHIKPEVSQLTSNGAVTIQGFNIPALSTRRAETTIELGSGQSFAIAGLLQNSVNHDLTKFPWLGDIPILGTLFRSSKYNRQETELVIIVTPYIVQPHNGGSMPMPTDGLEIPNDYDRYIKGQSFTTRKPDIAPPAQGKNGHTLKSAAGFILD